MNGETSPVRRFVSVCSLLLVLTSVAFPAFPQEKAPISPAPNPQAYGAQARPRPILGMTPAEARARITALRKEIAYHDDLYFKKAAPEISDFAYDRLKEELTGLETAFPEVAEVVPAGSPMGDDRTGRFPTCRHRERMLSLDKTYAEADLRAFHARLVKQPNRQDLAVVIEPKVDGLAINVTYENGKLVRAVTRGDGEQGDDITANALTIGSLPRALRTRGPDGLPNPIPHVIELRGEIYLPLAELDRINREREGAGEALFANPRNLAAGTVKQLDARKVAERRLEVVFYGWGACEPASMLPETQQGFHGQARAWGLPILEKHWVASGADEMWDAVQTFGRERRKLPFATDGVVVKLDSVALRQEAGVNEHAPRWAMAFKFAPERAETQLFAITIQVGRTGVLTPVAELAPLALDGATISRATLHNRDEIVRLDLRVGDHVFVDRAGGVIPAIVGVNVERRGPESRPFCFPDTCPACGAAVVNLAGEVALRCPSFSCPAQMRRRLSHFASSSCVAIDGLGPALIDTLAEKGWLNSIADLYRIRRQDLLTLGKNVEQSTDNLLSAIERSKRVELWRFIHGLGIPRVGAAAAREIALAFGGLEELAAAGYEDFIEDDRSAIAGVGEATARAIVAHFHEPRNRALVADLTALGVQPTVPSPMAGGRLSGKVFVLTGKLPGLTRGQAMEKIRAAGGRVSDSVSRNTDYVLAGTETGAKLEQAQALGIPIIDEAALLRMISGDGFQR